MAHHLFELSNGRKLGVSAIGDAAALRLVVMCHPAPGAGGFDPDPRVTNRRGVHVLGLDRPGYGSSDPLRSDETPSFLARADDIAEYITYAENTARMATGTEYGPIGVIGWQTGCFVALALAARYPHLVDRVALIDAQVPARLAPSATPFSISDLGVETSDPAFRRPGLRNRLDRMLEQAGLQGTSGLYADQASLDDPGLFDVLPLVKAPTRLIHGEHQEVDSAAAHWFRARLHNARVVRVRNGRALTIATQWDRILAHVATR